MTMNAITFDTLSSSRRLREKDASQELAEAIANELRAANQIEISHLATKDEVATLATKHEVTAFKSEFKSDLQALEGSLKSTISGVEQNLRREMAELKADIIKWMFGGMLTMTGFLVAILLKIS